MSMEYQMIDPRAVTVWRFTYMITWLIVTVILLATALGLWLGNFYLTLRYIIYVGFALVSGLLLAAIFLLPAIEYRQWRYGLSEDRVEIRHGIFWLKATVIPMVRIQHIAISQGPLNRRYGLAKLTIYGASGSFFINGLSLATAETLAIHLKNKLYQRLQEGGEDDGGRSTI